MQNESKVDVLIICSVGREKEIGAIKKGKRGRATTARAAAFAGGANRQEADRKVRMDVYDAGDGDDPESKRP